MYRGQGTTCPVCRGKEMLLDPGIYGVSLFKNDVGRASLKCRHVNLWNLNGDCDKIGTWLEEYVDGLPGRPVVFPTSDKLALMLANRPGGSQEACASWLSQATVPIVPAAPRKRRCAPRQRRCIKRVAGENGEKKKNWK